MMGKTGRIIGMVLILALAIAVVGDIRDNHREDRTSILDKYLGDDWRAGQ